MPKREGSKPKEVAIPAGERLLTNWDRYNEPYREARRQVTQVKKQALTQESIFEIGDRTMDELVRKKVITKEVRDLTSAYFRRRSQVGKKVQSLQGMQDIVGHTTAFFVWLNQRVGKPLAVNDFGGPPRGGRPKAEGKVSPETAVQLYSALVGRSMATSSKDVNSTIKFWVRYLSEKQAFSGQNYDDTADLSVTSAEPVSHKGQPLRYDDVNIFFDKLLFGAKEQHQLFARYLIQTGLRPDHAFWSLRLYDLERAYEDTVPDCTGTAAHLVRIKPAIVEAFAHETVNKEAKIKAYPESVLISEGLFNDLFGFVLKNFNSIRLWNETERRFEEAWKHVKWDKENRQFTGMTADEKQHSWVFMHLVPRGAKVADGHNRLQDMMKKRKTWAARYGMGEDPENKFVVYSLRKTWATVLYVLTQHNIEALKRMANWTEISTILTYIQTFSEGDAWLIKAKYEIMIPKDYISESRVLALRYEAANESVKRAAADMMEQIRAGKLPEEALYVMLAEAGVPVGQAPEVMKRAVEEFKMRTRETWALPSSEEIQARVEAGKKSTVISEAIKGAAEAKREAGVRCLEVAEEALKTAREKTEEKVTKGEVKTVSRTYDAMKRQLEQAIEQQMGIAGGK